VSVCRSCGSEIIWAYSEEGKMMPVDAEMSLQGNLFLDYTGEAALPTARVITLENIQSEEAETRFMSHFATCPDAKTWGRGS
jgi:hypothetical protein